MNPYIISKEVLDSIRECILSIFWAKNDVFDFLRSCGCPNETIKGAYSRKEDLTRKAIIDEVLIGLQMSANGIGPLRRMISELKGWSTFNGPQFASGGSLDIEKARKAVKHLKNLQESKDSQIREAAKRNKEAEEEAQQKTQIECLRKNFHLLYKGQDEKGKEINLQKRGYLFEEFLKALAVLEKLTTTESFGFNIPGEQIDGSIKFDGEHYIIEAKWQEKLVASNALYQFAHKVEGKMYGRGIFISINGFSSESVEALTKGKALKSILVDGADLALVVEGYYTFSEMLDRKIKAAQTMGNIYVNAYDLKDKCLVA